MKGIDLLLRPALTGLDAARRSVGLYHLGPRFLGLLRADPEGLPTPQHCCHQGQCLALPAFLLHYLKRAD
jgi:hypothetical protein